MPKIPKRKWPADMDPQCIPLCEALNLLPGIETVESCYGHGEDRFRICFHADFSCPRTLGAVEAVAWCADKGGPPGWSVTVHSRNIADCAPLFCLEGPIDSFHCHLCGRRGDVLKEAEELAVCIKSEAARLFREWRETAEGTIAHSPTPARHRSTGPTKRVDARHTVVYPNRRDMPHNPIKQGK